MLGGWTYGDRIEYNNCEDWYHIRLERPPEKELLTALSAPNSHTTPCESVVMCFVLMHAQSAIFWCK